MDVATMTSRPSLARALSVSAMSALVFTLLLLPSRVVAQDAAPIPPEPKPPAWEWDENDPRIGLSPGLYDAGQAALNVKLLASVRRPAGFNDAVATGGSVNNTDLAFTGNHVIVGNYRGFNIYDISTATEPELVVSIVCPGGQGDVSVFKNLLFMSVQETRGRLDCGSGGVEEKVSDERFRGVRIFDISDIETPEQVAAVQTCRGSHTHSLVSDPDDQENLYVYNSGTSRPRPGEEMEGCSDADVEDDPNTSYYQIEVIKVPLDAPQDARIVNNARVFADYETGNPAGLWQGGDHGPGTQRSRRTTQCHDITAFPEIGLAAGACAGNGILFDISDPENPVRIDEVTDPNFAYWHSATFNNDGSKVLFTDEWGGGRAPRCLGSDLPTWGANAIFDVVDRKLKIGGYYKLPAPQTELENCVAHNGSLIPVPGRDIKAQAWYQGGMSIFDFTDPENVFEIAFFDRGPVNAEENVTGGYWSTYWFNGHLYGSEIARGMDIFEVLPSEHLSQNEIDVANMMQFAELNPQNQPLLQFPAEFVVARAYVDQLERADALTEDEIGALRMHLGQAENADDATDRSAAFAALTATASALDAQALASLAKGNAHNSERVKVLLATKMRELALRN